MDDEDDDDRSQSRAFSWRWLLRQPKDFLGFCLAATATAVIVVNALFWQAGPHPAPIFTSLARPIAPTESTSSIAAVLPRPRPAELDRPGNVGVSAAGPVPKAAPAGKPGAATLAAAAPRPDPIADLLEPSTRLMVIQRALAEFGYGQIKPTGLSDPETKAAIEKFEQEHKLPVTGQMSDRLFRELTAMKGGPL